MIYLACIKAHYIFCCSALLFQDGSSGGALPTFVHKVPSQVYQDHQVRVPGLPRGKLQSTRGARSNHGVPGARGSSTDYQGRGISVRFSPSFSTAGGLSSVGGGAYLFRSALFGVNRRLLVLQGSVRTITGTRISKTQGSAENPRSDSGLVPRPPGAPYGLPRQVFSVPSSGLQHFEKFPHARTHGGVCLSIHLTDWHP